MNEPFFIDYLERLENLREGFHAEIQGLSVEALDWVPGPEMNSMAVLLAHTTGSLRFWIGDMALGEPSNRVREQEFETHGVTSEEMLRRLDVVFDYARAALPRMRLDDLGKERSDADGTVTYGWALLHAMEHGYMHLGHIQITSQLWRLSREKQADSLTD